MEPMTSTSCAMPAYGPACVSFVGAGFGDVSLLAASVVGPGGSVVGVERDETAAAQATERAAESGARNVSFDAGDLRDVELEGAAVRQ